jgi:starch synthase
MKIAFIVSEATPYAKTGGLADVAGALPHVLSRQGLEVKVFMPLYRDVRQKGIPLLKRADRLSFDEAGREETFALWESLEGGASVYFIDKPALFDRDGLYGTPAGDYPDNGRRFAFFSRAALVALKALDFPPDVLHVHDWQASIAPAYLRFVCADDSFFRDTRTLLTIHNLAYQGLFDKSILAEIGLPDALFHMDGLEFFGKVSFLKAGILYATAISTVSHRYSLEIQTPEFGCGLDGLLRRRGDVLTGILNGVDYAVWDPAADRGLAANYAPGRLEGKGACKKALLAEFKLPADNPDLPLVGMVTRLVEQKGLDLVLESMGGLFAQGLRLVVLGTGDIRIQQALETARRRFPSFFGLRTGFDEALARKIYAGSDMFLIPSHYEPCGLTQMYSLKYGTVPIVRATGGLDDSIREFDPAEGTGNGFKFGACASGALLEAVRNAVRTFARKADWSKAVQNAMASDFSWERSAREYGLLYRSLAGR